MIDIATLLVADVLGQPVGKGRPRAARMGAGVRMYTPSQTASWEQVAAQVLRATWYGPPYEGPVRLQVLAVASRPKRLLRRKDPDGRMLRPSKPDVDNVAKAVADALVKAGVIRDDIQVTTLFARSLYAARNEGPRVEITLWPDAYEVINGR